MAQANKMQRREKLTSVISGLLLLLLCTAAGGFWVAYKQVWPFHLIAESAHVVKSLARHGAVVAPGRLRMAPVGANRTVMTVHLPDQTITAGAYALLAFDDSRNAYSVFLYAGNGSFIHKIPIDDMALSATAQHRQNGPHGMAVLADGSVLIGFDRLGLLARISVCGKEIWTRSGFFHHSLAPSADGGLWTWYGKASAYGQMQDIVKIDPTTGADMARIPLQEIALRDGRTAHIFGVYQGYHFVPDAASPRDIFHPNDVEELLPALAPAFPQFTAGDLLISLRNIDLLAVISQEGVVKWHSRGPWLRQHDPDFEPDGQIAVFDNSSGRPRSHILRINPADHSFTNATAKFTGAFKSEARGKHQLLPNGNRLITIPEQGQALEITADGRLAVEFNNVFTADPRFNDDLVNAQWLPEGFFTQKPGCTT